MRQLAEICTELRAAEENVKTLRNERDSVIAASYAPGAYGRGDLTMKEIAEIVGVKPATISKIIDTQITLAELNPPLPPMPSIPPPQQTMPAAVDPEVEAALLAYQQAIAAEFAETE